MGGLVGWLVGWWVGVWVRAALVAAGLVSSSPAVSRVGMEQLWWQQVWV